ncbi:MAG: molecular chaperone DnaJ [Herbinix sp.]|nr:molecular chaperone DnaJ [Herbinix sp.]
MNDWERLGIDPTLDVYVIKKAYAIKLKSNHPEDDPQGFQELREAYDRRLQYAKNYELHHNVKPSKQENVEEIASDNSRSVEEIHKENESTDLQHGFRIKLGSIGELALANTDSYDKQGDVNNIIQEFFDKVRQLYQDFYQRQEYKNWQELLNHDILWNLNTKELVSKRMLDFLSTNYLLPRHIWKALNRYFEWSLQEEYIRNTYNVAFVSYLFLQLGNERVLRYCYFDHRLNINYEEYVYYRETAFMALLVNDIENANRYLYKAAELYLGDPELYCLRGEFCMRTGDYRRAEYEFQAAISMNSRDTFIYYYKANVYYLVGNYYEALKICNMIADSGQFNYELQTLAGRCYVKLGNLKKAEDIFLNNFIINPSDKELMEHLESIRKQYLRYLKKHPLAIGKQMRVSRLDRELYDPELRSKSIRESNIGSFLAALLILLLLVLLGLIIIISAVSRMIH